MESQYQESQGDCRRYAENHKRLHKVPTFKQSRQECMIGIFVGRGILDAPHGFVGRGILDAPQMVIGAKNGASGLPHPAIHIPFAGQSGADIEPAPTLHCFI